MQMFFFGRLTGSTAMQVLAEVGKIIPDENIEVFQTTTGLSKRLRELSASPEFFVLVPANHEDLVDLLSVRDLFGTLPLILVLPDQRSATVQSGHLLQPRFLTFSDSNLSDVGGVTQKIKETLESITEAQINIQQRALWSILIQCPFFEGAIEYCPLQQYRKSMNLEEKFQFSISEPPSTVKKLLEFHQQCFQKRQQKWMAKVVECPQQGE